MKRTRVVQLDYYTGEIVAVYNSVEEASKDNFILASNLWKVLKWHGGKMRNRKLCFAKLADWLNI
ncbi:MAG: hypothetical protein ATN36_06660 [Epulopiscium sp. Nele67-Bin005]|nr:MAG: hypothetical protein ATN36_06660 [Epulopiscium sp. Nele67-Bin005]